MKLAVSLVVLVIMAAQCGTYIAAIRKKDGISPALSTWIIFLIGTGLSLTTYILSKKEDFLSGIVIVIDTLSVVLILAGILVWGNRAVRFRSFEKWYLAGCVVVVGYGLSTGDAFGSNLFAQVIIATGYLPTYQKLIREKVNTESYRAWGIGFLNGIVGLIPAILGHDTLAVIYAVRGLVLIAITILLMAACDAHQKRQLAS